MKKIDFVKPKMQAIEMKAKNSLLAGSGGGGKGGDYNGGVDDD